MRKLIQAYTDEAGQVVVDPAIIKAVQDADRIYILAARNHSSSLSANLVKQLIAVRFWLRPMKWEFQA